MCIWYFFVVARNTLQVIIKCIIDFFDYLAPRNSLTTLRYSIFATFRIQSNLCEYTFWLFANAHWVSNKCISKYQYFSLFVYYGEHENGFTTFSMIWISLFYYTIEKLWTFFQSYAGIKWFHSTLYILGKYYELKDLLEECHIYQVSNLRYFKSL